MKRAIKRYVAAFVLTVLITNAVYTVIYRFVGPNPATRWLPLYDWIYNTPPQQRNYCHEKQLPQLKIEDYRMFLAHYDR